MLFFQNGVLITVISEIDNLIKNGNLFKARQIINNVDLKKIARDEAVTWASLSRRCRNFTTALRILKPYIFPSYADAKKATDEEIIEYASSLRGMGAYHAALDLLNTLDSELLPTTYLHKSFCLFAQWNYSESLPFLQKYIEHPNISDYERIVGKVNLASALIGIKDYESANRILLELQVETNNEKFRQLHINTLEMLSQIDIFLFNNPEQARSRLISTLKMVPPDNSDISQLFLKKWLAIAESKIAGKIVDHFEEIVDLARELSHWETIRDLEYHRALITNDLELIKKLYFGTPYQLFRDKILKDFDSESLGESYFWGDQNSNLVIDLSTGNINDRLAIESGSIVHKVLICLCRDFYRPTPVLNLFQSLYPGEFFDIDTSINRTVQSIRRLRKFLNDSKIPIEIIEEKSEYQLKLTGSLCLTLPRQFLPLDKTQLQIIKLKDAIDDNRFTAKQIESSLGLSRSAIQRLLSDAVSVGLIKQFSKGRSSFYTFSESVD